MEQVFNPSVFITDAILGELFKKVSSVPIFVLIAIKLKNATSDRFRCSFRTWAPASSVEEAFVAAQIDGFFPAANGAFIDFQDFSNLSPG